MTSNFSYNTCHRPQCAGFPVKVGIVCSTDGIDYRLSLGTFTLTQSENTKCFEVTIVDDDLPEHEENFTLVLSADNALSNVSHPRTAMVIIQENDRKTPYLLCFYLAHF